MKLVSLAFGLIFSLGFFFSGFLTANASPVGVGHGGGGDTYVAEFYFMAKSLIDGDTLDPKDKLLLSSTLADVKIVMVPVLIDQRTKKPVKNQHTLVAWGSPKLIQLKSNETATGPSWESLRLQQQPVLHLVFHELYRASGYLEDGKSPDESFELSVGKYRLDSQTNYPSLLIPTPGNPVCFRQKYRETEVKPNQMLSQLAVMLEAPMNPKEDIYHYYKATVVAKSVKDQQYYGHSAICELRTDGSANCFKECDGGGFLLRANPEGQIGFSVPTHYKLYKNAFGHDPFGNTPTIPLNFDDIDNSHFDLKKMEPYACEIDFSAIPAPEHEGC